MREPHARAGERDQGALCGAVSTREAPWCAARREPRAAKRGVVCAPDTAETGSQSHAHAASALVFPSVACG